MDSTDDPQTLEITALQSIYAEDFIECPPSKAWKVRSFSIYAAIDCLNDLRVPLASASSLSK